MFSERTIYDDEPERLEDLHGKLAATHDVLVAAAGDDGPLWHAARINEWRITLGTSADGELVAATSTRMGEERHAFMLTDEGWKACGRPKRYEEAHFGNLVTMAVRNGLEWKTGSLLN